MFERTMALRYVVTRGLRGMVRTPLVQLLCIGTIASCMLLLGTTLLVWTNIQAMHRDLGLDVPITVYLASGTDTAASAELVQRLSRMPEVEWVEHVSQEAARERLARGLGDERGSLAELDVSLLPETIDVSVVPDAPAAFVSELADHLRGELIVEEVADLGPWAAQAQSLIDALRWIASIIAGLVSIACTATVWTTVRLAVFARRDEVAILSLLGGTRRFVRGPFLFEGCLQGALGAGLAVALLAAGFELVRPTMVEGLSLLLAAGNIQFLSTMEAILLIIFGGVLGVLGSRGAVARHILLA